MVFHVNNAYGTANMVLMLKRLNFQWYIVHIAVVFFSIDKVWNPIVAVSVDSKKDSVEHILYNLKDNKTTPMMLRNKTVF